MLNNTFFIVCREKDMRSPNHNLPGRDRFGYEFVDLIERMDWETAKRDMLEYRKAMPSHHVCIRPIRIGENYGRPAN